MNNYFLLWCIPFFGVSIFHLYACLINNNKYADISKAILMPMLLFGLWGFTALTKNQEVLEQNMVLLSLGIIFGGMGDIYLLKREHLPNFVRGIAAFLLGHIFYLIVIFSKFTFLPLSAIFITITIAVYILLIIAAWLMNNRQKGPMGVALVIYATVLASFNAVAFFILAGYSLQHEFSNVPSSVLYLFIGSTLFLVSDAILSRTIFVKTFPLHRFIVMLTYLAAQFFIIFGISTI